MNENSNYSCYSKYDSFSKTNKLNNKSISLASTITKTNSSKTNSSSSQKDINNVKDKLNKCFDIDIQNNNNYLVRTKSNNSNFRKNNSFFNKIEKNNFCSSYYNYRSLNHNHILSKNLKEIKNYEYKKNNINLKNNNIRKLYPKPYLNNFNIDKNEIDFLLNHFPYIERHRKNKFNEEINYVLKDMKKELNDQNKRIMYAYNQKNIMTPFKIIPKNHFSCSALLNDEDMYKFNIMTKSKILNVSDIKQKNLDSFFNIGKFDNYKRSSSLENLNLIINNRMPKYISDYYCNNKITSSGIKINKYKSSKLHEIYESLKN